MRRIHRVVFGLAVMTGLWAGGVGMGSDAAERLYVGTGEYNEYIDWHAVMRFDTAHLINSPVTGTDSPNGTVNVKKTTDSSGLHLNFAHGIWYDPARDEMYLSTLFTRFDTNLCPDTPGYSIKPGDTCGSIAVIGRASMMNGLETVQRHIVGRNTRLNQPHGVWVDRSRDILYVANTFAKNILVWDSPILKHGDSPPSRSIEWYQMGNPVNVMVDEPTNRLFVACMNSGPNGDSASILIYDSPNIRNGIETPIIRLIGSNTFLDSGNNQTTHNVVFNPDSEQLYVAHHTNEVLMYNLRGINWHPPLPLPRDTDPVPRVLKINESSTDTDIYDWSVYGLFHVRKPGEKLYVSAGYTPGGTATMSGYNTHGTPMNAIKVYNQISDTSISGRYTPSRLIWWTWGDTYFPPQPIWVQIYPDTP